MAYQDAGGWGHPRHQKSHHKQPLRQFYLRGCGGQIPANHLNLAIFARIPNAYGIVLQIVEPS